MNNNTNKSVYIRSCFIDESNQENFFGKILSVATGFFVENENKIFLITNRHVVTGEDNFTGKLLDKENAGKPNYLVVEFNYNVKRKNNDDRFWANPFRIPLYKENVEDEAKKIWLEHPKYKNKIDVVAIDVTEICKNSVDNLRKVGNCTYADIPRYKDIYVKQYIPYVTEKVYVIGYPFGFTTTRKRYLAIWNSGTIASEYEENLYVPIDKIGKENDNTFEVPTFLIDAKTRSGQSGSPVITLKRDDGNEETILLGIYSGRVSENSDLGYVWKTELIYEIISG